MNRNKHEKTVGVYINPKLCYPVSVPYHPDQAYPELQSFFPNLITDINNNVYAAVRELFRSMRFDIENYGLKSWNPLSVIISAGDTVVLKPNLLMHEYEKQIGNNAVHTHGSVIRAISDYILIALKKSGELIIADAPGRQADYDKLIKEIGLKLIKQWYNKCGISNVETYDLRFEWAVLSSSGGLITKKVSLPGDPKGYEEVDTGRNSALEPITLLTTKFSVDGYDDNIVNENHQSGKHRYCIAKSVLDADVIINVPKLKTHMKVGLTCCLKNLVGINADKGYLPHHRIGTPAEGGDELPRKTLANVLFKNVRYLLNENTPLWLWKTVRFLGIPFRRFYSRTFDHATDIPVSLMFAGSWYGNDTTWRMVHDINKIAFYADKKGKIQKTLQRKYFAIVDAIVAGEGDGPLIPKAKQCGMLLAGFDPLAVDTLAALCMGFDPCKIPLLAQYQSNELSTDLDQMDVSLCGSASLKKQDLLTLFRFEPPSGWKGHIES